MNAASETSKHREKLLPFIAPCNVIDIGYGGDPVVPWAIACDMAAGSYTRVGAAPQQLGFDCRTLPFRDATLDTIYSSHLLEDFSYEEQIHILREWLRCLRTTGTLILLQPDQPRYLRHCRATGQPINLGHIEPDYSLATFKSRVWGSVRGNTILKEARDLEPDYSWMFVAEKL